MLIKIAMKTFIITLLLINFCSISHAHTVEQYVKTKNGITLFAFISRESIDEREMYNVFLDGLISNLERRDKKVPIFIMVDQFWYSTMGEWFATIAFDILRKPDPDFINHYYQYRMGQEYSKRILNYSKPPSNKYKIKLPEPIDFGSSYDSKKAPLGIKITYNYTLTDSSSNWDRLYTLVQYAIDNIDEIKRRQKRIVLPFYVDGPNTDNEKFVSLLTIDTGFISTLPLQTFDFKQKPLDAYNYEWLYFIILTLVIIILFLIFNKERLRRSVGSKN